MKYKIAFILVLILSWSAFSQTNADSVGKIKLYVADDLRNNLDLISEESQNLTLEEKESLYMDLSYEPIDVLGPFALNTFFGFGIGSFAQGDIVPGWIGFALDLTGSIIGGVGMSYFAVGSLQFFPSLFVSVLTAGNDTALIEEGSQNVVVGTNLLVTGLAILAGSRIYQMIMPWTYKDSYNKDLQKALGVESIAFNITPTFDYESEKPQIVASIAIKL